MTGEDKGFPPESEALVAARAACWTPLPVRVWMPPPEYPAPYQS